MTATSDPPSPDTPGAPRPRSGPVDVSVDTVVAARAGDAAAFARMLEHWDVHLRPFVHLTLAGKGSTDRVLAAAYLRAYRALPRYKADRTPGLWLHRVAYLAVIDEVRREHRDPLRIKDPFEALPLPDVLVTPEERTLTALRRLATDQRAMTVMVDLEGFRQDAVADVFDTNLTVVRARLGSARRVLTGSDATALTAEARMGDADQQALSSATVTALRAVTIPEPGPTFWADLGRRLLAEREQPASPTPDPIARLKPPNPPHPAEPGFKPDQTVSTSIAEMADLADRTRPGRPWGRYAVVVLAILAVVGVVAAAVDLGTSDRPPDGTVSGAQLAATLQAAMKIDGALTARATVTEAGTDGARSTTVPYDLVLGDDGSWSVNRTDTLGLRVYNAATGITTQLVLPSGQPVAAGIDAGLATGDPDPGPVAPPVLTDLQTAATFLRADPTERAPRTRTGGAATWTMTRTVPSGPDGADEEWAISVRRSDGVPLRVERRRDGDLVRISEYSNWTHQASPPDDTFEPKLPDGVIPAVTNAGFNTGDLAAATDLGRGKAITPSWLPAGFSLATVATRLVAPTGVASTAGGKNPPDVAVLSMGFQRGPERITVSMRNVGEDSNAWEEPFASWGRAAEADTRTLGDGHYNGVAVTVETAPDGRARLWGVGNDAVFTVSGDLTADEAFRIASSLR